jgi:hypothetical protein
MKMGNARKHLGLIAVPANNTAAVTEHTNNTTMFPVGSTVFV